MVETLKQELEFADALTLGRHVRARRKQLGLKLEELAAMIDRAPSQLSAIENGKREPRLPVLRALAEALNTSVDELLSADKLQGREGLEVAVERALRGPVFEALGLPAIRVSAATSDEMLKVINGLHQEIERLHNERAATPAEARRANTQLRQVMREQNNYFANLEEIASDLLSAVHYSSGPVSQQAVADIAKKLGYSLHYVSDLPHATRSVVDKRNGRIYLATRGNNRYSRTQVLRALAGVIRDHAEPRSYAEFLEQRVEANYLAGAILLPESSTVEHLRRAKKERDISIENMRDSFAVSYEMAAHRFTNLATHHLDMPVHFMKVHESGTLIKAYENDNVKFAADALGALEGARVCARWTARTVFEQSDRFNAWYQYTDMPDGRTYWCTSRIEHAREGDYSISVGVAFDDVRWFRGRDTAHRTRSYCPEESCCSAPNPEITKKWQNFAWPEAATPTSLLAALPTGNFPGVDNKVVFNFLERHDLKQ